MSHSVMFYELLKQEREHAKVNSVSMDRTKYQQLINKVKSLKHKSNKDGNEYRFLKRYDIIKIKGVIQLISPPKGNDGIKYFACDEDLFEILHDAHIKTDHGGRDRMVKHLKVKYKNITYKDVLIFISLCELCSQKQKVINNQKKATIEKPILYTEELNHRCQVDLIDFQKQPDNDFKFILLYQDYLSKFLVLRALKSNTTSEICQQIIDIFTLFGAPPILDSDYGQELVDKIMNMLVNVWPNFKIVYGKPRYDQKSVLNLKDDIENMLIVWMKDHNTSNWSYGLKFIQMTKNSAIHNDIKKSPYKAMFGVQPRQGLATSNIPADALTTLESEEDLEAFITEMTMCGEHVPVECLFEEEQSSTRNELMFRFENGEQLLNKKKEI